MTLKNKILTIKGQKYYALAGKTNTDNSNRSIWLFNASDNEEPDYSLWNVETTDEEHIELWPYEGENSAALLIELLEDFVENAFKD